MKLTRRNFVKIGITTSGSLIFGFSAPLNKRGRKAFAAMGSSSYSNHYIEVTPDNKFIFTMDKSEMGQGVITGQLTLFAEEADIDPEIFEVKTAPVDEFYATMNGLQITGGSTSTSDRWIVLREAGARFRELMLLAAAQKWNAPKEHLRAENGVIYNVDQSQITFGELINHVAKVKQPEQIFLKSAETFKYIGQYKKSVDAKEKSTGQAEFGVDFETEGLLVAVVERCPTFGGKLKSFDASQTKKFLGVKDVFAISSGVAIVCEKYWQCLAARKSLKIVWEHGSNKDLSSDQIESKYFDKIKNSSGHKGDSLGDTEKAFKGSQRIIEAEYVLPYLSHSAMEPMNAAALVKDGHCEIWSPNQAPTLIRNEASRILGIDREFVKVHTTKYLGGGFGRRSTLDYSMEAVEVSKKMGLLVKVMWSREDDTKFSPMRPFTVHKLKGGIRDKKVVAWEHKIGGESILQYLFPAWVPLMLPGWVPSFIGKPLGSIASSVMGGLGKANTLTEGTNIPYSIKNKAVSHYNLDLSIPIHFWRSVGNSHNGFVVESFIDEMAAANNEDPLEFRRKRLPKNSPLLRVLNLAAEKAEWGKEMPKGKSQGLACYFSFNTYVAEVAEIEIVENVIKVTKVFCAVDCGTAVNPDIVQKQMESGIIYGLSAALKGQITIESGGVKQSNFDDYPVLRASDAPEVEVFIVPSTEAPTGVGEPGLPPIAAAVGNAIFRGTGKRLRRLPFELK